MATWKNALTPEAQTVLRDFEAMEAASRIYGARLSDLIGDFGEGYGNYTTGLYRRTFVELSEQLEAVAMEAGKLLGIVPEIFMDTENDYMDSDTWSGAVAQEIKERNEMDATAEYFRKLQAEESAE